MFFIIAIVLAGFGYWGEYTISGHEHFEEMAGMIPFFSILISVVFGLFAAVFGLIGFLKKK